MCDCTQPGESLAKTGVATKDRKLVPDEFAAGGSGDGRKAGKTCPLLLALLGGEPSTRRLFGAIAGRIEALTLPAG